MKQSKALDLLKAGKNVFLTGSAGAGKTYTLNQYIQYLRSRKVAVAVTASTGIAATHANGVTIHTWAGIGIKNSLTTNDLETMKERKHLRKNMEEAKVLIIDEISMLHAKQLDMVNEVLKYFKGNSLPFGGMQVVFSGDFFQLPPVGDSGETNREKFAFMSKAWLEAGLTVCYLSEQHRQEGGDLDSILNEIRSGLVGPTSRQILQDAQNNRLKEGQAAPKLYTHNADVDAINRKHLDALKSKSQTFAARTKGNAKVLELLKNTVRTDEQLLLKVGAKVMFIKNNFEKGYINGTLGEIEGFTMHEEKGILPMVKLHNGYSLQVEPEEWSIDDHNGKSLASFIQLPLRLAWAITIHKSQGMTLDAAEIDLSHCFERGQGYVALSRLKSLEGLFLRGFNDLALELDPLALRADARFKELSQEADIRWTSEELQQLQDSFVLNSGGTLDPKEIQKTLGKVKAKKEPQKSTYEQTKELIDMGLSIEEMAEERGLTPNTIVGHLAKIKELYPALSLHRFRPKASLIKKVAKAHEAILAEAEAGNIDYEPGKVSMNAIYQKLQGAVSYEDIRLALLFVD